ncbi:MAG TPA: serine hydrolase domain-containing protein [Steroidobacteraceae bacterium]|nr:serine hydrolase domain-containing protein [Steroidobacteraceae bacterium]
MRCFSLHRVFVLLLLAGSAAAAQPGGAALDQYLESRLRETQIPGMVAMVVDRNGPRYTGAFGRQNVGANLPMHADTIFRIASMTKPVTSLAVMMLVEEGKVKLDDPIEKYLPEYANPRVIDTLYPLDHSYTTRPAVRSISIRHLLTHTSGLGYGFASLTLTQLQGEGPDARPLPSPLPLLHDPGALWSYGESTRVLGLLVEKLAGQPLDVFMQQRIFQPLGMNDTSYAVPAGKVSRVVTVHRWVDGRLVETPNTVEVSSPVQGDGGLNSTAADYAKFIGLFLRQGRTADGKQLVSSRTIADMGRNHTGNVRVRLQEAAVPALSAVFPLGAGRDSYGLGFQVTGTPAVNDMRSPGSLSWAGIFNTEFWIDPEKGIGGILLMQYLPFYDKAAIETLHGFEQRVYQSLGR